MWTSALPMGNGHLGAMAYGGPEGRFDLSEVTCWSGAKQDSYLSDLAEASMKQARELLLYGEIDRAEELLKNCLGVKENYGTQLPMAVLECSVEAECDSQTRELDIFTGICLDTLNYPDCTISRESFISSPDKAMVIKITPDNKTQLPPLKIQIKGYSEPYTITRSDNEQMLTGRALETMHSDGVHGVDHACILRFSTDGSAENSGDGHVISGATWIVCFISAATNLFNKEYLSECRQRVDVAGEKGFDQLRKTHVYEHTGLMCRCSLNPEGESFDDLPTDERLALYKKTKSDKGLVDLFFQYGRYLLISSSRADSVLPAALQGVWNDGLACRMAWTDDMHLDINTQMNYYSAEMTGLGECCTPLYKFVKNILMPEGEKIARQLYGVSGWTAHTVTNAHGWAAPGWDISFGFFVTAGAWIASHIWQHYLFTENKDFLEEYWLVLRGSAEFLHNILMTEPDTNKLVIVPSYSPENSFVYKDKVHFMTIGSTADMLITRFMFEAVIDADRILEKNDSLTELLKSDLNRMASFEIGRNGQLKEWFYDYDEATPDHRHTSHLISVYPFSQISLEKTPELADAVKITLRNRLGENAEDVLSANWSVALLILYYARLKDSKSAEKYIDLMITDLAQENLMITHKSGIYELDGNTGLTAGIVEMLVQSRGNKIVILPSLLSC